MPDHVAASTPPRVRLRADLLWSRREDASGRHVVVEDPVRSKFFRLGEREADFAQRCVEAASVRDAWQAHQAALGAAALTADEAQQLLEWCVKNGLARGARPRGGPRSWPTRLGRLNPLCVRIPLGNPDPWLRRLVPWLRGCFGVPAGVAWCGWVALAVAVLWSGRDELAVPEVIWSPRGAALLAVLWVALKAMHEAAHGLACVHFGGRATRAGVMFLVGVPCAYVDVTSAWTLASKWQRIAVALVGVMVELAVAAGCVLAWAASTDPAWRQFWLAVALMSGVSSVVFNANPLMRYDGYFALADWLEIPNLARFGQLAVARRLRSLVGLPATEPLALAGWRASFAAGYGVAAAAWRLVVLFTIVWLVVEWFGWLALGVLAAGWLANRLPVWAARWSAWRHVVGRIAARRYARWAAAGACLALAVGVGAWSLSTAEVVVPVVVEYEPLTVVRAESAGFVARLHVADGDAVAAGQLLVELENPELAAELTEAQSALAQSLVRSRQFHQAGETHREQAEMRQREALVERVAALERRIEGLSVRAPRAGTVVRRRLDDLAGTWVREGDELAVVGDERAKQLLVVLDEAQASLFDGREPAIARARLPGRSLRAHVHRFEPRAECRVPHPALSAEAGGPLPVQPAVEPHAAPQLLSPRVVAYGRLAPEDAVGVAAGQTGWARVAASGTSRWLAAARALRAWLSEQAQASPRVWDWLRGES